MNHSKAGFSTERLAGAILTVLVILILTAAAVLASWDAQTRSHAHVAVRDGVRMLLALSPFCANALNIATPNTYTLVRLMGLRLTF
jgi:hypothetical protein